jgi:signal transduction histidine kinase
LGKTNPPDFGWDTMATEITSKTELRDVAGQKIESNPALDVRREVCGTTRLDRITRGIVHDVNNHLSVIINYTYVLARHHKEESPLSRYVEEIQNAAWRASKLSQQLLAPTEKSVDEPQLLDINFAIREISPLLRNILGEAIDYEMRLDPDLSSIVISLTDIEQILLNLAIDARNAMLGRGKFSIETANCDDAKDDCPQAPAGASQGSYVRLTLSDSRLPIREQDEPHAIRDLSPSLGHLMVMATVKKTGGLLIQRGNGNGETSYNIYFPVSRERSSELKPVAFSPIPRR